MSAAVEMNSALRAKSAVVPMTSITSIQGIDLIQASILPVVRLLRHSPNQVTSGRRYALRQDGQVGGIGRDSISSNDKGSFGQSVAVNVRGRAEDGVLNVHFESKHFKVDTEPWRSASLSNEWPAL
jgi:hypothetical protein